MAIYFANSFKQITENTNLVQTQELASKNQYSGEIEDEVIDIDKLLSEAKSEPKFPNPDSELGIRIGKFGFTFCFAEKFIDIYNLIFYLTWILIFTSQFLGLN